MDDFTAGRSVWERREIGSQACVVTVGRLSDAERARARSLRLALAPLSLQQLVVRMAARPAENTLERISA